MSCHKKCLVNLQMKCGKPQNFLHSAAVSNNEAPASLLYTIAQCVGEINERGLDVKVYDRLCFLCFLSNLDIKGYE